MSHSENGRLTRAPQWFWLTLGGASTIVIVVAVVVALRPRAEQKTFAAAASSTVNDRELPPIEPDTNSFLVSFPRQPGIALGREGDGVAEQLPTSTPASATEATIPGEAASIEVPSEAETKLPPKPDPTAAVGVLASIKSNAGNEATKDSDDQQPQPPVNPSSNQTDPVPEPPRGPDRTYTPAKIAADAATENSFENLIRELLDLGWTAKATGLRQAEEKFKASADLSPEDPRASYAYGLVLLKHNQYDGAIKQFDSVGEQGKPPYLPAFRAAIWLCVLKKAYEPAALDLVNLTRVWQAVEPDPLPEWVQSGFVAWTGHMVGYLEGPLDSRSVEALCKQTIADLHALLSPSQRELFKESINDVLDSYAAKATVQDKARLEAKRQQDKEAEATKTRLAEESTKTKQEKKQVDRSAEELERSLKDQLGVLDSQFSGLAREYDRLDLRARNVANSIRALDQEIASLVSQRTQLQAERSAPPPSKETDTKKQDTSKTQPPASKDNDTKKQGTAKTQPSQSSTNTAQILAINATIDLKNTYRLRYQADYDRLEIQARDVQRQGTALLSRRQSLINDYQTTTGKLYKEKESLAAKEKFLERRKQEISKPATGSTGQVKALGQTAKALRTYVDLNLELEKQRVLDSFATP